MKTDGISELSKTTTIEELIETLAGKPVLNCELRNDFVPLKQAATNLGMSHWTLRRGINSGLLPKYVKRLNKGCWKNCGNSEDYPRYWVNPRLAVEYLSQDISDRKKRKADE